ncbi:MAG TPA: hypothetical protein DET40_24735 [Lentisphaeria bacterium]|nr:MAG: hypothetical protein A2X45_01270 [Lentisphaerae bacterium GWF2_50_93]HCE46767.1 hypothetical protein [Lentisphaeria bacterium]
MDRRLLRRLKKAGRETRVWSRNGMRILVLKDGGRLLGLYAPDSKENFFWVNPRIYGDAQSVWKAKWPNPGGDRCWLSPACGIHLDQNGDHARYQIPERIDPGYHDMERWKGGMMRLCNVGKIFLRKAGKKDTFALERYVSWAENPLCHMEEDWVGRLFYAGYSQKTRLESLSCNRNNLSIWNILQVPTGGEVFIPAYNGKSIPRACLGMNSRNLVRIEDAGIILRADGKKNCMISIPPQMSTGRIGYVRQAGKEWTLVVRSFHVNPSGEYLNCMIGASGKPGYAVQCRIVSDGDASHVELHHHVPVNSSQVIYDTCQTWCFRGNQKNIHCAAACLTGYESVPSNRRCHREGGL